MSYKQDRYKYGKVKQLGISPNYFVETERKKRARE
jgi:hypothetical protein